MRMRTRLLLTLIAIAIPLVVGAIFFRIDFERRSAVASLADFARTRMESGGREVCEAAPVVFQEPPLQARPPDRGGPRDRRGARDLDPLGLGPPGPGPDGADPFGPEGPRRPRRPLDDGGPGPGGSRIELFAYAKDFKSANPRAPAIPAELKTELEAGANVASTVEDVAKRRTVTVLQRMSWSDGPAAITLTRRFEPTPPWRALDDLWSVAVLVGLLLIAVLFAVGSIVRRVRHLTEGVRLSAAERYRAPVAVEGHDEIAELALAFNSAGAQVRSQIELVEQREKSLRNFVENTTHDVMLPLTVLQGHLIRLRNELAKGTTPDRETVRDALEESHYLASLVQNLGAAAKLEAGEPELKLHPFVWNALVERVVMRHKTIAKERGIELDFAVPENDVRAEGDVTLVEQALSNVVHNAVRYNRSGGHVALLLEERDGRFSVRVFDDGPGVPDADLARIAERSYRSDDARARYPDGLGLGLSIARDVAARHAFDITFRRADTGGLEVEFRGPTLPRATNST
jgi:signal transduction histidine kinase